MDAYVGYATLTAWETLSFVGKSARRLHVDCCGMRAVGLDTVLLVEMILYIARRKAVVF